MFAFIKSNFDYHFKFYIDPSDPPAIRAYTIDKNFPLDHVLTEGKELAECFPEDILAFDDFLYVACGVPSQGILKYDLNSKKYLGKFVEGDYSAIWGLAINSGYLYFSSHCTGMTTKCVPKIHDKV